MVARLRSPLSSCDSPWSIWSVVSSAAQLLAGLSVPAFTARLAEIVAVGRSGVLADDVMRLAVVDLVSHIVGKRLAVCAVALGAEFCAWSRSSLLVARLRSSTSACDSAWSIWSETLSEDNWLAWLRCSALAAQLRRDRHCWSLGCARRRQHSTRRRRFGLSDRRQAARLLADRVRSSSCAWSRSSLLITRMLSAMMSCDSPSSIWWVWCSTARQQTRRDRPGRSAQFRRFFQMSGVHVLPQLLFLTA